MVHWCVFVTRDAGYTKNVQSTLSCIITGGPAPILRQQSVAKKMADFDEK
jgi:hypothetical protein